MGSVPQISAAKPHDLSLCVQEQLHILGYDPGPADGAIGPNTRSALAEFLAGKGASVERLSRLPRLTRASAVSWCREIGKAFLETRSTMPGWDQPEIHVAPNIANLKDPLMKSLVLRSRERLLRITGVQPASDLDILVATNAEDIITLLKERFRDRGLRFDASIPKHVKARCSDKYAIAAAALRHQIYLCLHPDRAQDQNWLHRNSAKLQAVMVHEFVHHMQRDLSNDKTPHYVRKGQKNVRRRLGPGWMIEGTAQIFERESLALSNRRMKRLNAFHLRNRVLSTGLKMQDVMASDSVRDGEDYLISHFATKILAEKFGNDALVQYWQAVGDHGNWDKAFSKTYGMTLDDYMDQVDGFLASSSALQTFLKAP